MKKSELKQLIKDIINEQLHKEEKVLDANVKPFTVRDKEHDDVTVLYFKDEDSYILGQKKFGKQNNIKVSKEQLEEILKNK